MSESHQRQDWIEQARRGSRLALTKVLAAYCPMFTARITLRMGSALRTRMEPEDILQEVCADVFRQIGGFTGAGESDFINWTYTIIESKVIDAKRMLQRRKRDVAREVRVQALSRSESYWNLLEQLCIDSGTPSRIVRRDEALDALVVTISGLTESHRQVIQMRFLEGRSVEDAARRLGRSEAAVVALTRRALDALRRQMNELGEFTRLL
jgi:RNA polymerase sigma-70 factor (subfamily 1)